MAYLGRYRSTLFGAGAVLAFALLLGRISGFGRELVLASRFGISEQADIAVILLTLPDLLVNLLLSGGLSAALVPRLRGLPPGQAAQLFRNASFWAMAVFGLMAAAIAIWPAGIFGLFAPGLSNPTRGLGDYVMLLLALSVPLTALSGITAAYLNAGERFFIAGLGTLIFNLAVMSALLGMRGTSGLLVLAAAILGGSVLRLTSQAMILPRQVWHMDRGVTKMDQDFLAAFLAGVLATSLTLIPPALIRAVASLLGTGNIATFNYAQKLVELPLGILITTISTIALTRLSGHHAAGDFKAMRRTLYDNLRLSLILAIMILIFGQLLAGQVVSLIFLRGAISEDNTEQITFLVRIILFGVPFIAVSGLAAAALNAKLQTTKVLRATAISIASLIILALPGILISSDGLLMLAVVGSQAILAWLLARRAEIWLCGAVGVFDRKFTRALCCGLAVALVFAVPTIWLDFENAILAMGWGAVGFGASIATSVGVAKG